MGHTPQQVSKAMGSLVRMAGVRGFTMGCWGATAGIIFGNVTQAFLRSRGIEGEPMVMAATLSCMVTSQCWQLARDENVLIPERIKLARSSVVLQNLDGDQMTDLAIAMARRRDVCARWASLGGSAVYCVALAATKLG